MELADFSLLKKKKDDSLEIDIDKFISSLTKKVTCHSGKTKTVRHNDSSRLRDEIAMKRILEVSCNALKFVEVFKN